ncbi:MAG TPA: hypothetical protein VKB76_06665 [Ktedonobacterales bacterium]|nr:hypothetical protein [Ktedonobacterales bacterium]
MHILLGICFALVLLYTWLVGWRYPRLIMFLLLAAVGFVVGAGLASTTTSSPQVAIVVCGSLGAALAWPLASIPLYYRRHQERQERLSNRIPRLKR